MAPTTVGPLLRSGLAGDPVLGMRVVGAGDWPGAAPSPSTAASRELPAPAPALLGPAPALTPPGALCAGGGRGAPR
jgi:hypothetical protein